MPRHPLDPEVQAAKRLCELAADALEGGKKISPVLKTWLAQALRSAARDPKNADRALGLRNPPWRSRDMERNIKIAFEYEKLREQGVKQAAAYHQLAEKHKRSESTLKKIIRNYKVGALARLETQLHHDGEMERAAAIAKKTWAELIKAEKRSETRRKKKKTKK